MWFHAQLAQKILNGIYSLYCAQKQKQLQKEIIYIFALFTCNSVCHFTGCKRYNLISSFMKYYERQSLKFSLIIQTNEANFYLYSCNKITTT